jgi:radical SAM superfamily enzyme YgiQ (UPF0313 family)
MKRLRLINPMPNNNPTDSGGIFNIVPLQLVTIASLTPDDWEVEIQDEAVERLTFEGSPTLVGITLKACTARRAFAIADRYRAQGIPVVFGGSHTSLAPDHVRPHASALLIGSAEGIWDSVLADASAGRLAAEYRSPDTGMLPRYRLRWEVLGHKRYAVYSVVATRGCPLRCSFCSIPPMYDRQIRRRAIEDVLADIVAMGSRRFILWDENPTADRHFAETLFQAMAPLGRTWFAETTTMVARDERLLRTMSDAGCRGIYLGVESVTQDSLNRVKKGFNRASGYRDMVARLHDHGIAAHAGIVFGFDDDDADTFDRTLEYLAYCRFNSASLKILTPYPGTPLHDTMQREGRIFDANTDNYDEQHVVFTPRRLTTQALLDGYRRAVRSFYSLSSITRRIAGNIGTLGIRDVWPYLANFGWRAEYLRSLSSAGSGTSSSPAGYA